MMKYLLESPNSDIDWVAHFPVEDNETTPDFLSVIRDPLEVSSI
jgi:hypothetical protein